MKILYDCFSCSPYYGSDEGIGWSWPYKMREMHEVYALVRKDREPDITRYCKEHGIHNIHFIYCDIPDWMNLYYKNLKRGKNGLLDFLLYQYLWQFPALRAAKKAHKKEHFDIIHHIATNDFRLIGRLHHLGIPFLIGPIGGAQETPEGLKSYVASYKKSELLRKIMNHFFIHLPGYRKAIRKADRIFFSNSETMDYLFPGQNEDNRHIILSEVGVEETTLESLKNDAVNPEFTFLWAGRMEYRKGLELLIDVLKLLPLDKQWKLVLCGDGKEKERIERLVHKELFADRVLFLGRIPHQEVLEQYRYANAFVFPSLRETTGTVLAEAMAHGLPVICLNQGGAKTLVENSSGFLVSVKEKEQCLKEFADAMISLIENPELAIEMGRRAQERIKNYYTWQKKCTDMDRIYQELIEEKKESF